MLKDLENVGLQGSTIKVADGYAQNFLIPRGFAIKVGANDKAFFQTKSRKAVISKQVLSSKVGMLAERIRNMRINVKKRVHDDGKLYGAVGQDDVVELLKKEGVNIVRKQVVFEKAVRKVGEHSVSIKLNSSLKPTLTLKVSAL